MNTLKAAAILAGLALTTQAESNPLDGYTFDDYMTGNNTPECAENGFENCVDNEKIIACVTEPAEQIIGDNYTTTLASRDAGGLFAQEIEYSFEAFSGDAGNTIDITFIKPLFANAILEVAEFEINTENELSTTVSFFQGDFFHGATYYPDGKIENDMLEYSVSGSTNNINIEKKWEDLKDFTDQAGQCIAKLGL